MRVKARVSFTGKIGDGFVAVRAGQELDLPDGCDWLTAGLVVEVAPAPDAVVVEEAIIAPPNVEYATTRKRTAKGK